MNELWRRIARQVPTLIMAFALAVTIWVLAVTSNDPVQKRNYNQEVDVEVVSLDPSLVVTSKLPEQISFTLSAPLSVWNTSLANPDAVRAIIDLSGLEAGTYDKAIQVQINARPVKVESYSPQRLQIVLEPLVSVTHTIRLDQPSAPAVGYEAGTATLSANQALVSGPSSQVEKVQEVRASLDIAQANADIDRQITLRAYDANGVVVPNVAITPERIRVQMKIIQRGGYRTVTVKLITSGQPAAGYRLTNITVSPLTVTVFSSDPRLISQLPGFIETQPLVLTGASADEVFLIPLNVPKGISVVSESIARVSVSIAPIEGSLTLNNVPIEILGLSPDLTAALSPDRVDVILTGPLPLLDKINSTDVRVMIDLSDLILGSFQIQPTVEISEQNVLVQSILPASIEVLLTSRVVATPTGQ